MKNISYIKIVFTIILICWIVISLNAQTRTYVIIDNELNTDGSSSDCIPYGNLPETYTGHLDDVIVAANNYLNEDPSDDKIVKILFNVPLEDTEDENSALVVIDEYLPDIEFEQGKLILDVYNQYGPKQGVVFNNSVYNTTLFEIDDGANIEINNLYFEAIGLNQPIIKVNLNSNVKIENNVFIHDNSIETLVKTICFRNCFSNEIEIINNQIESKDNNIFITYLNGANAKIHISGNNFSETSNSGTNLKIMNLASTNDPTFIPDEIELVINNNSFNSLSGDNLELKPIVNSCSITRNTFKFGYFGIILEHENYNNVLSNRSLSFIESNQLDIDTINTGNIFQINSNYGFAIAYNNIGADPLNIQSKIIGYSFPSYILVNRYSNVVIRENNIINILPAYVTSPIILSADGNNSIPSPQPTSLTYTTDGYLEIGYTATGLNTGNAPYVVDIYGSNENNDLLSLVDSDDLEDLSGTYSKEIVDNYEYYSMTLTSIGEGVDNLNGIGTSEAILIEPGFDVDIPQTICAGETYSLSIAGPIPFDISSDGGSNWAQVTVAGALDHFDNTTPGTYTYCIREEEGALEQCYEILVEDCPDNHISCEDCIGTFAPNAGGKYLVGAWVSENTTEYLHTYENAILRIKFYNTVLDDYTGVTPLEELDLYASGNIIDGWQKIEEVVTIPVNARGIEVELINNYAAGTDVFFDDIRFQPFNSSMKTYVYDYSTGRLAAVNDENNYATFYEYDEEGALVRVKKETERGIMTIQESRNEMKTNP
ncbi:MAG: hypothetical protein JXR48_01975 [Candidatus Delongbacteria bacterium]|nr:hypothetical protein [Candidatus Delongbacteria bacterium]